MTGKSPTANSSFRILGCSFTYYRYALSHISHITLHKLDKASQVSLKMPACLYLYTLSMKKKNCPCYTFPVKKHTKFPCCYFRTVHREFWCIQKASFHCSSPGSSLVLYLKLCRSLARGLLSDLFQKCVSHALWESQHWR